MKRYPEHHHDYTNNPTMKCPICGAENVTAYMIKGGAEITMKVIRRRYRFLFKV